MNAREFLSAVLPAEGYLIAATPITLPNSNKKVWWNKVVDDVDELIAQCTTWTQEEREVYFAVASYRERQVWNAKKIDHKTGKPGAYEKRTQANVSALKSLFLDIDVKPTQGHYHTQQEAAAALRSFCVKLGLPKPFIVNSGGGLHVYWVLDEAIPREEWQPVAEKLKAACTAEKLLADHNVTADAARVLRPPGTSNFKEDSPRPVAVAMEGRIVALEDLAGPLTTYVADNNVPVAPTRRPAPRAAAPSPLDALGDNLGATNNPLDPDLLVLNCLNFARQVANRGATASEPEWYVALGLARFCDPQLEVMLAVSDGHAGFDRQGMQTKADQWLNLGPPTCAKIAKASDENQSICEGCRLNGKIASPASRGRPLREAPPLEETMTVNEVEVKVPPPPKPYVRATGYDGATYIALPKENDDGEKVYETICPYDLYPKRILRQTMTDDTVEENTVWVVDLPRLGEVELKLPQALLSDTRKLHGVMLSRGAHMNANEAKRVTEFMTAYIRELSKVRDREKMYQRLGWHDNHRTFVTPTKVYMRDGTILPHQSSGALRSLIRYDMTPVGDHGKWFNGMKEMYDGPLNWNYRLFGAATFGSMLLHMTGHKGVLFAASGDTGRGKTTLLQACASIFGDPALSLIGGGRYGTTMNGMWMCLETLHSLPMFWDDTTERDPAEMRDFMLHISTGQGKIRMKGSEHDGKQGSWETFVLSSANTDDVHRILATGKDSSPHLMRMMSVDFDKIDRSSDAKKKADKFRGIIMENHGHAGAMVIPVFVQKYEEIKDRLLTEVGKFDTEADIESQERYWSASIGSCLTATRIAYRLGAWPWDPYRDLDQYYKHVHRQRYTHAQSASNGVDILVEYLNSNVGHTLTLQAKGSSNLDNVVTKPVGELLIRKELDGGLLYMTKDAFNSYCSEVRANYGKVEAELIERGILLRRSCQRVLGADTTWATGQTRCWEISLEKLQEAGR